MGLTAETNHEKKIYLSIVSGKFAKRVEQGTEGAVERTATNPQTKESKQVFELLYKDISGTITSFEIDETGKFGAQLKINMADVIDKFTITLPLKSSEAEAFLRTIPNINFKNEIKLVPYNFIPSGETKKKIGMNIIQNGEKVRWFYSLDTPNGLPLSTSTERLDADEWEALMLQQSIFLKKQAKKFIEENFKNQPPQKNEATAQADSGNNGSDGLPF